jgi:hypothetical protein
VLTTTTITSSRNNIAKKQRKKPKQNLKISGEFSIFFRAFSNGANLDLHDQNRSNNAKKTRGYGRRSRKLRNKHYCNGKEETEPFFRHRLTLVKLPLNLTTVHHCVPVHRMRSPFTAMMIHPSSPFFQLAKFRQKANNKLNQYPTRGCFDTNYTVFKNLENFHHKIQKKKSVKEK